MSHQSKDHHYNKFWFGFALGSAVCGAAAMLVGTKQGRKNLRKTLDYMEHAESQPDQVHNIIDTVSAFYHQMTSDMPEAKNQQEEEKQKKDMVDDQEAQSPDVHSINSVIEKMKNITTESKTDKKFFVKPKK